VRKKEFSTMSLGVYGIFVITSTIGYGGGADFFGLYAQIGILKFSLYGGEFTKVSLYAQHMVENL